VVQVLTNNSVSFLKFTQKLKEYGYSEVNINLGCPSPTVVNKKRGSGLMISMESACIGSLAGLVVLLIFNGFSFGVTWFTLLMAAWAALNGIAFTFCAFKALDYINLSLFSVFAMLGGMVLPFLQGIFFFGEGLSVAKIICLILITLALCLTVSRGEKKKGTIYYIGVFVLNGMSGVLSKIFASAPFEKTSSAGYSIWIAVCTAALSGIAMLIFREKSKRVPYTAKALAVVSLRGAISQIANFFLVIALLHVDASVQYPLVTGGVMIVSTALCFFGGQRPSKKEILSVIFAFIGMLAMFVIPI
jgi:drug/metabolite transporter (DMT)-like permease